MHMYQKTLNYLKNCVQNDQLAHAYLFYGPDAEGKLKVAREFAKLILGLNSDAFCPDLLFIAPDDSQHISIERAREVKRFLSLRPIQASRKVVIIERADWLKEDAQHTLLKTLEEAPSHSVIIMLASSLDSVFQTIVSRTVRIPFWRISRDESPQTKKYAEILLKFLDGNFAERQNLADEIIKKESDISMVLSGWLYFLQGEFENKVSGKNIRLTGRELSDVHAITRDVLNNYFLLKETNVNPKYVFDKLALTILK